MTHSLGQESLPVASSLQGHGHARHAARHLAHSSDPPNALGDTLPAVNENTNTPLSDTLPHPPRTDLWPVALQSAELLRDTLVRCGPGMRLIGWPEGPRTRAAALTPWIGTRFIAIEETAAWVWGARRSAGTPLRLATRGGARCPYHSAPDRVVRELQLTSEEVAHFQRLGVTSPLRTLFDLLHRREDFTRATLATCRLLVQLVPGGVATLQAQLSARSYPGKKLALERSAGFIARTSANVDRRPASA